MDAPALGFAAAGAGLSVTTCAAVALQPQVRPWLLFSHQSAERGHARVVGAGLLVVAIVCAAVLSRVVKKLTM